MRFPTKVMAAIVVVSPALQTPASALPYGVLIHGRHNIRVSLTVRPIAVSRTGTHAWQPWAGSVDFACTSILQSGRTSGFVGTLKLLYAPVALGAVWAVTTNSLLVPGRSHCTASTSLPRRLGVARIATPTVANPAPSKNLRISDAVYSRTCPMWPTVRSLPYSRIGSNASPRPSAKLAILPSRYRFGVVRYSKPSGCSTLRISSSANSGSTLKCSNVAQSIIVANEWSLKGKASRSISHVTTRSEYSRIQLLCALGGEIDRREVDSQFQ